MTRGAAVPCELATACRKWKSSSRATPNLLQDECCNGLAHIDQMAQPVLLLDLADIRGETMLVKHIRYPP
jgi:hypothetical protein